MSNLPVESSTLLVEPLTRRELDILKLLSLNLTNREIADRLILALNSVKWYASQVYTKLEVENRHQAVDKARQLGLLPSAAFSRRTHNLPRQITRLIGREKEIARVVEMIWEYSLITLTGPGGVGKTRLALAAAEELLDDFANGVWFVEIAPLSDPLLVERTLADVLGVREEPGRSLRDSLVLYLQERQALLIFDNCEHMLDACASLVSDLLKSLPDLKVLISSREPLGVTGEAVFRVPSLAFPSDEGSLSPDRLITYEAVSLFQERARAALPDFQFNQRSAVFVAQICRRLDGIPLAIELAASRVSTMDVEQIVDRLDQAFRLLSGGSRNALERHRTLRAAVDWSFNLLAEKERTLLRRLSVFVGGCTLEAAEAVCSGESIEQAEILDLLSRLVQKSMLVADYPEAKETRYHLLETIRQYAEEKHGDPGEIERLRSRHCDWFVRYAEFAEPLLSSKLNLVWKAKLAPDLDNFRAALAWSIGFKADPQAGMRLVNALVKEFWCSYYYAAEARHWTEKGLAALSGLVSVPSLLLARSLLSKAWLTYYIPPFVVPELYDRIFELCKELGEEGNIIRACSLLVLGKSLAISMGDLQKGLDALYEGEAILRSLGESGKWTLVCLLDTASWARAQQGNMDGALAYAQETSALSHELESPWSDIEDVGLGYFSYLRGDYAAAEKIFEKAAIMQHKVGDPRRVDHWHRKLGDVYRAQGKFDQAVSAYREAMRLTVDMANWTHIVYLQCCFTLTAIDRARDLPSEEARLQFLHAARILGTIQPMLKETGAVFPIEYKTEYDRSQEFLRERLDPASFATAWAEGRAMNRKQVVAYLQESDI